MTDEEKPQETPDKKSEIVDQTEIDAILEEAGGQVEGVLEENEKPKPAVFDAFDVAQEDSKGESKTLDLLMDIPLDVKIELGRTSMLVEDILRLGKGAVISLDKLAGDPVDVIVNGRPVARGEVVVLNDNFCVRITEIVNPSDRLENIAK